MSHTAQLWNAIRHAEDRGDGSTAEERRNLATIVQGAVDLNDRKIAEALSSFSENYQWTSPLFDHTLRGTDQARRGVQEMLEIFPDIHFEIELNFGCGQFTQTIYRVTGTRVDGFMGLPPKQVHYRFSESVVNEFDSFGRRLRTLEYWDRAELLGQLGVGLDFGRASVATNRSQRSNRVDRQTGNFEAPSYQPGGGPWKNIEQRNYESVARGITAFNRQDVDGSLADLGPKSVWRSNAFPKPIVGKRAAIAFTVGFLEQFPDTTFETLSLFAWREYVQVLFLVRGTKTRGFLGLAPRDHPFQYYRSVLSRYDRRGCRVEVWDVWDEAAVLRDQGFMQPIPTGSQAHDAASRPAPLLMPPRPSTSSRSPMPTDRERLDAEEMTRLESLVSPQTEDAIRTMVRRVASFDMVGELVADESSSKDGVRGEGRGEIRLVETSVLRSIRVFTGHPMGSIRLSWRAASSKPGGDSSISSSRRLEVSGDLVFTDAKKSSARLRGFGFSDFTPHSESRFGAVLRLESGSGELKSKEGLMTLNDTVKDGSTVRVALRVSDPTSTLRSASRPSGRTVRDPCDLVIVLAGADDPQQPVQFQFGPDGTFTGAHAVEKLSLADFQCGLSQGQLRSLARPLTPVGEIRFDVRFVPFSGTPADGMAFRTKRAVLEFSDSAQQRIGSLEADIVEGRAYEMHNPGGPIPCFRMGGIAPIQRGHGLFDRAHGWVFVNSVFSLVPRVISSVVTIHLVEPGRDWIEALQKAWP